MLNLIVSRCHKTTQFQCQLDPQKVEQDSLEHKQKPTLGQAKHVRQSDSRGYIYIYLQYHLELATLLQLA